MLNLLPTLLFLPLILQGLAANTQIASDALLKVYALDPSSNEKINTTVLVLRENGTFTNLQIKDGYGETEVGTGETVKILYKQWTLNENPSRSGPGIFANYLGFKEREVDNVEKEVLVDSNEKTVFLENVVSDVYGTLAFTNTALIIAMPFIVVGIIVGLMYYFKFLTFGKKQEQK